MNNNLICRFLSAFTTAIIFFITGIYGVCAETYSIDGYEIPVEIIINDAKIATDNQAFLDNGTTYVPLRALSEALGAQVYWDESSRSATSTRGEKSVSFSADSDGLTIIRNEALFVPIRALSDAFGLDIEWDSNYYQVHISAPDITVPSEMLDFNFQNSDILLLAQVLQCESGFASFEGKIAVANVILNRVNSDLFPSTVYDVIYDCRGGSVQFPLAYNGKINNIPSTECILAAKCAVSGTVIAKDCLFFQTESTNDSWTSRNRTYAMTCGGNDFFY